MPIEPTQRLSDAEREAVVTRLQDALSEGRLDLDDFNERLDRAYAARTHGEIVPVTEDLPKPKKGTSRRTPEARRRRLRRRVTNYLGVNVLLWSIWGTQELTGGSAHDLWPLWVTIPYGAWIAFESIPTGGSSPRRQLPEPRGELPSPKGQ